MSRLRRYRPDVVQSPLETYLREINQTALLTADQEKSLARAIEKGDTAARDQMVRANLRLVVNIARGYTGKGMALQDLIEEGNLGLLRAVEGFDPTMNTRFSTYASYWIKQSIKRALVNTAKTIRIPAYMVELLSKWRRATNKLNDELGTHHGLSWADFVLLTVLDAAGGAAPATALARSLHIPASRLLLRLLPLEKTGLVERVADGDGKRRVTLRPPGRRLLHEARDTAANACAP